MSRLDSPLKRSGTHPEPLSSSAEVTVTDRKIKFHIKISILYLELFTPNGEELFQLRSFHWPILHTKPINVQINFDAFRLWAFNSPVIPTELVALRRKNGS
jgi:hypothetical protein